MHVLLCLLLFIISISLYISVYYVQDLIEELMEFNLRTGSVTLQKDVQGLLCQLTRLEGMIM